MYRVILRIVNNISNAVCNNVSLLKYGNIQKRFGGKVSELVGELMVDRL